MKKNEWTIDTLDNQSAFMRNIASNTTIKHKNTSIEEVIDKIKGYIDHIRNTGMGKEKSLEFIEKFIDGLKAGKLMTDSEIYDIEHSSWIPVSERLPERWQLVNITIKDYDENLLTGVGYYRGSDDGTWFITAGDGEFLVEDEVIAWMPLPEPYKAESEVQDADSN